MSNSPRLDLTAVPKGKGWRVDAQIGLDVAASSKGDAVKRVRDALEQALRELG